MEIGLVQFAMIEEYHWPKRVNKPISKGDNWLNKLLKRLHGLSLVLTVFILQISEVLLWAKEQSEELSPNLTEFTEHFNKMSYW